MIWYEVEFQNRAAKVKSRLNRSRRETILVSFIKTLLSVMLGRGLVVGGSGFHGDRLGFGVEGVQLRGGTVAVIGAGVHTGEGTDKLIVPYIDVPI